MWLKIVQIHLHLQMAIPVKAVFTTSYRGLDRKWETLTSHKVGIDKEI